MPEDARLTKMKVLDVVATILLLGMLCGLNALSAKELYDERREGTPLAAAAVSAMFFGLLLVLGVVSFTRDVRASRAVATPDVPMNADGTYGRKP